MTERVAPDAAGGGLLATAEVLARVTALLDAVDHDARGSLDAPARLALVDAGVQVGRRIEALRAVLVGEAEHAKAADTTRGTSIRSLLTATARVTPGEAAGWVHRGTELVGRRGVRDAALTGDISVAQARAIHQVLDDLPATLSQEQTHQAEHVLLGKARILGAKELAVQTRTVLHDIAPDLDATEHELSRLDAQRAHAWANRAFTLVTNGRGSVLLRGQLPTLEAEALRTLVAAYTETNRRVTEHNPGSQPRTAEQRNADGFIALITAHTTALGLARTGHAAASCVNDATTAPATDTAPAASTQPQPAPSPSAGRVPHTAGDRPRVHVTMSLDLLQAHQEQAGLLADGQPLSAGELRRLLCDADLIPVVLGTASEPLDVGRTKRLVPPGLRRALTLRDGGCTFPGCTTPDHLCEAHHIIPWWRGGLTALHNLVLLCPYHHGIIEPLRFWSPDPPARWQVTLAADGHPEFTPPSTDGEPSRPVRHQRTLARIAQGTDTSRLIARAPRAQGAPA